MELLPIEPGRGFTLMPSPQQGDLFFDMEGDPLYPKAWNIFSASGDPCHRTVAISFMPSGLTIGPQRRLLSKH